MFKQRIQKLKVVWFTILVGLTTIGLVCKTEVQPVTAQNESNSLNRSPPAPISIKQIRFIGNTVFSDNQLRKIVAPTRGEGLSFAELYTLRSRVSDYYAEQGYVSTSALIPTQNFADGIVEIQIIEGSLKAVEIEGLSYLNRSYIDSRLPPVGKVLNLDVLRKSLVRLKDNPLIQDLKVDLLEVSPGQNLINLEITENNPVQSSFAVTNTFSPSVGKLGGTAEIDYHLLGHGDLVSLAYTHTESNGLRRYNAGYSLPVNSFDGKASFSYINADARIIEEPLTPLDIQADFEVYQLGFRQPINLNEDSELALEAQAELVDSQSFIEEDIPNSFVEGLEDGESQVTALRFIQEYFSRNDKNSVAVRSQFNLGLDLFDATVNEVGRDGLFWSWQGQTQWLNKFNNLLLVSSLNVQLTDDKLLPIEQITLGGNSSVRGYRQNLSLGDNGVIGNVELQVPLIRSLTSSVQVIPFVASGTVWNNSSEKIDTNTLVSLGLGLSYELRELIEARIDYAIPLIEANAPEDFTTEQEFSFVLLVQP